MPFRAIIPALALCALLAACTTDAPEPEPTGEGLYADYCAACHGADARGGPAIEGRRPPDLTRLAARHGGRYPAVYVMSTIDGYAREAIHGPMPIFGELIDSPVETWTDPDGIPTPTPRALMLLNAYLEGLQQT